METINLNGKEYILKEEYDKITVKEPIQKFDLKLTIKLLKAFNEIFSECSQKIEDNGQIGILDPANVMQLTSKNSKAREIIKQFIDPESKVKPAPKLEYVCKEGEIPTSKYSLEYLNKIFEILSLTDDSVRFTMKNDYPITIENEDFKFLLAPRVGDNA